MSNAFLSIHVFRRGFISTLLSILLLAIPILVSAHGPDEAHTSHFAGIQRLTVIVQGDLQTLIAYDLAAVLPQFQVEAVFYHDNQYTVELRSDSVVVDDHTAELLGFIVDNSITTLIPKEGVWLVYDLRLNGKSLTEWLEPLVAVGTEEFPSGSTESTTSDPMSPQGRLSGRRIMISPGHGKYWNGSAWVLQRGYYWGVVEDYLTHDMALKLKQYLEAEGATVWFTREPNRTAGNGESGSPRWQEAARYYIKNALGQQRPDIWNCSTTELNDDICSRPLYANYRGADLLISIHSNGGGGTGTETWYDTNNGYQTQSLALANNVQGQTIARIRSNSLWTSWYNRGVKGSNGGYGENRRATRPAIIIETAFHDRQTPDNAALQNHTFQNLVALGICDGILAYYGQSGQCNQPPYVYFDDFSNSTSGWTVAENSNYRARYRSNTYELTNYRANTEYTFVKPQFGAINYSVEADMWLYSGSPVRYGLVFDWQNASNYYVFSVNPTSRAYSLVKFQNGTPTTISSGTSTSINSGTSTNHLEIRRVDGYIEMRVNGQALGVVSGGYTGNRSAGVSIKSGNDVPVTARFDNYSVDEIR